MSRNQSLSRLKDPAFLLGMLGGAAGAVSIMVLGSVQSVFRPLADMLFLEGIVIHPALLFGLVIGFGVGAFGGLTGARRWASALAAFAMTVVGWVISVRLAVTLHELKTGTSWLPNPFYLPGFAAGAAGAAMVFLGGALTVPVLRDIRVWGPGVAIGAVIGLLFLWQAMESGSDPFGPLFMLSAWQAGIGCWFGWGLRQA